MTNAKRFAAYHSARAHYQSAPAIVSPKRPLPMSARMMRGICVAALVGAAALVVPTPVVLAAPSDNPYQMVLGAAGAWTFYNEGKKYLMSGDVDLNTNTFRMGLYTSASNATTATLSRHDQVTNEVTEGNGYSSSGKALTGVTWTAGASASEMRFDATALIWTATGGNIANVKFAVIFIEGASAGARKLLCYSQLSTAQFTITTGNTLTITPSANGIFELN